jgi:hypothetical protein
MNPLLVAAGEVQEHCRSHDLKLCFIGGLAVLRWGEPRLTRDVDLTVIALPGSEQIAVDSLLEGFASRIADARAFALANRVLLLRAANGVPLDVALGALDFELRAVERATPWMVDTRSLLTCSAEDLIIFKTFAGRDRDWLDVEGVVIRQGRSLDRALICAELEQLLPLKGSTDDLARIRMLLDQDSNA